MSQKGFTTECKENLGAIQVRVLQFQASGKKPLGLEQDEKLGGGMAHSGVTGKEDSRKLGEAFVIAGRQSSCGPQFPSLLTPMYNCK